jgi:tripartite ATP-independent transporter DctM subunit
LTLLLLLILALLVLVLIDVPIAVALGAVSVAALAAIGGVGDLPNIGLVLFDGPRQFTLIAIPLFILAGAIMNASGISQRLIALVSALLGFVRGGLAMVTVGTSMVLAEMSGSAVADVAALGPILIPAMKRKGYTKAFAAAVLSSSSTLAIIIPPSLPMILYAVMSGTSVVELFIAGVIPGVLGGLLLMLVSYVTALRRNFPVEGVFEWSRVTAAVQDAAWALTLPIIILGGIFSGFVTATEGAGLAVVASLIVGGLVYRELTWRELRDALIEAARQTAVVMLLVATSALLGDLLTSLQIPQQVAQWITGLAAGRTAIIALLNVFFLILGCFLHSSAAIILVVPIVMPLVQAAGIDPVQFGVIVTLNMAIGQQTPPVASVLVSACSIAKADVWEVSKANVYFVGALLAVLVLVSYVPAATLFLVDLFYR